MSQLCFKYLKGLAWVDSYSDRDWRQGVRGTLRARIGFLISFAGIRHGLYQLNRIGDAVDGNLILVASFVIADFQ
jgi:hypothetical protein